MCDIICESSALRNVKDCMHAVLYVCLSVFSSRATMAMKRLPSAAIFFQGLSSGNLNRVDFGTRDKEYYWSRKKLLICGGVVR